MWPYILIIFIAFILYRISSSIDKRLKNIEETRGPGESYRFNVNAMDAIMHHKSFGELTKIKSATEDKDYKDWTDAEQDIWHKKYAQKISNLAYVHIQYIASENAFFISTNNGRSNLSGFISRFGTNDLLYSAIVLGDEDGFKAHLEFQIYERLVKTGENQREWMLTPCLRYQGDSYKEKEFIKLCEFPLYRQDLTDEKFKEMGFEVERQGGDDFYTDNFGENRAMLTMTTIKKNGVEFGFVI